MRQACQEQKVVTWGRAQRSRVSTLPPKTCQFAVSVTTPGHWGEVSVLPRGLDKQALGKFPLEAEAKDLG